jgi:hypothetical protein
MLEDLRRVAEGANFISLLRRNTICAIKPPALVSYFASPMMLSIRPQNPAILPRYCSLVVDYVEPTFGGKT